MIQHSSTHRRRSLVRALGAQLSALPLLACALALTGCSGDDGLVVQPGGEQPGGEQPGGELPGGTGGETGLPGTGGMGSTTPLPGCEGVVDACPVAGGLVHACKSRFSLGINYAWHNFSADFGGVSAWNQLGVSQDSATFATEMADMRANGAQTIRWWMFPDFRGDGVTFDANDLPTGLSSGAVADIQAALDLAEAQDVYLVLTLFSFDNFRPTRDEGGLTIRGMTPMVQDPTSRALLINNIVRPAAQAVADSPNAHRLLGWDIINEPEWAVAVTPGAPNGEQFDPDDELATVTLEEMKALINESAAALKEVTPSAQVSVGWAAAKWAWAFTDVTAVDFHQPHIYGWVNDYYPYTLSPTELGYGGKPTVMGEFYLLSMPFADATTFDQIVSSWYQTGFAGAWSWQYNENKANLGLVKSFADANACTVAY